MKVERITDPQLTVRVTNQMATYDPLNDKLSYSTDIPIDKWIKRGYLAYDMSGRNIGILFRSDDKRTRRHGNSELLFFSHLQREFGTWRTIKIDRHYFYFSEFEKIIKNQSEYIFTTDKRTRVKNPKPLLHH